MFKSMGSFAAISAAIFFASSANAEVYVGAKLGIVDFKSDIQTDNAAGVGLTLGFGVNDNFAVEMTYLDLGNHEASDAAIDEIIAEVEEPFTGVTIANAAIDVDVSGFELALVGKRAIGEKLEIYGRLGYFDWSMDLNADITTSTLGDTNRSQVTDSLDDNDISFALGTTYKAKENLGVFVEFSRYQMDNADADFLGAGIKYSF